MKRLLSIILGFMLICCFTVPAKAEEVHTFARAYALYCANNGELILSDNPDERLPMASTTKLMTALITLKEAEKNNRVITFTEEMSAEGSSMYLKPGEQVKLYDLAVGMMMQSGNDAANAAAIAIAGSIEKFADRMNRTAKKIGMQNTHFVTPSGLDDPDHYSTARDLAKLMAYALNNDSFLKLTAQTSVTVTFIKPENKRVTYPNHNRLLSMYDGCIGGKTGYTQTAGRCLVTAARRGGLTLIAVTLDDPDDWDDHMRLYDEGFARYTVIKPDIATGYRIPVVGGVADETAVYAEKGGIAVPRDRIADLKTTAVFPPFLYAPVKRGQIAGYAEYTLDGRTVGTIPLLSADDIAYNSRRRGFFEYIADMLKL